RFRAKLLLVSGRRILQRSKPLSTTSFNRFRSIRPKHQQSSTATLSARRILLEFAIRSISFFIQLLDLQGVFREDCAGSGAHYRGPNLTVNSFLQRFCNLLPKSRQSASQPGQAQQQEPRSNGRIEQPLAN